jgi:hypothetical protein
MSRTISREQLDVIEAVLKELPGATIDEIAHSFNPPIEERRLQRWLNSLVESGRVKRKADRHVSRFYAIAPANAESTLPVAAVDTATPPPPAAPLPTAEQLFAHCLPQIIMSVLPKISAIAFVQTQAGLVFENLELRKQFVSYAMERLEILTDAEAISYGLTLEQFTLWKQHYVGYAKSVQPLATEPVNTAPAANTSVALSSVNAKSRATLKPKSAATERALPASINLPTLVTNQAVAKEVAAVANQLNLGELWSRGLTAVHATITRPRALLFLVWAIGVWLGANELLLNRAAHVTAATAQQFASTATLIGFAMFPAAGLPWLFFRWRDRVKANEKTDSVDVLATLFAAGTLSAFAAKICITVFTALIAMVT